MLKKSVANALESFDLFAQPVTLTFKGKRSFGTLIGGCLSLVIVLAFAAYSAVYMKKLITEPVFHLYEQKNFFEQSEELDSAFNLTTKNSTVAVYIGTLLEETRLTNQNLRVVFTQFINFKRTHLPAVNCTDFFSAEIAASKANQEFFEGMFDEANM